MDYCNIKNHIEISEFNIVYKTLKVYNDSIIPMLVSSSEFDELWQEILVVIIPKT